MLASSIAADCSCTDYSLLQANTGVVTLTTANPNLDGSGALVSVITASANGTLIKSLIIKAAEPTTGLGMVRLFINNGGEAFGLIREIPIGINPALMSTPTPFPVMPTLEIDLIDPIRLQSGDSLHASTQSAQTINVIAEGLDWAYPEVYNGAPGSAGITTCCNFEQLTALTETITITTANPNLNGSGTIASLLTAASEGTIIRSVTIAALTSTQPGGMVRFFINDGEGYTLWMEVMIPSSTQSSFIPSFKVALSEDFHLQAGYSIGVSTHLAQSFAVTIEGLTWSYPL